MWWFADRMACAPGKRKPAVIELQETFGVRCRCVKRDAGLLTKIELVRARTGLPRQRKGMSDAGTCGQSQFVFQKPTNFFASVESDPRPARGEENYCGNAKTYTALLPLLVSASGVIWQYGYELSKQTYLKSGTLYPLLMRLSDQGLLASRWQEPERPGRPPRHAYRLTPTGLAFAREIAMSSTPSVVVRRKVAGGTT